MSDLNAMYGELKFWLPMISGFSLAAGIWFKAKKSMQEWASKLLDNHLSHIQTATENTAASLSGLTQALINHEEKEMQVWQGVVRTLDVLEDRTSRSRARRRRKK